MATNSELLTIIFFFAIGFIIYKLLEKVTSSNVLSKSIYGLIAIGCLYLIFGLSTESVYALSIPEMIAFGIILPYMLKSGKKIQR